MKNRSRAERKEDHRLPVLLLLGLFICLFHFAGPERSFLWNRHDGNFRRAEALYVWLDGKEFAEGMYRLADRNDLSPLYAKAGITSLAATEMGLDLQLDPFSTLWLEPNRKPRIAGLHPRIAPFFFQPIPINKADVATLTTIPGIGPKLARRIVELREQRGGFRKSEELLDVSGIGKKKLATLRREVRFN